MKTAVSLPDELFQSANELAQLLGMSRSQLHAMALAEYVTKHRDEEITSRLNEVLAAESSGVDPALRAVQVRSVGSAEWQSRDAMCGGQTSMNRVVPNPDSLDRSSSSRPTRSTGADPGLFLA